MQKKTITVSVPEFNEEENIRPAYERIKNVMESLTAYNYEIVFFDDGSTDGSRAEIEALCEADPLVRAVFYTRNFGYAKTVFYCMQQARGDAAVIVHCDLQNPPEEIPRFIERWEQGADVVLGVKNKSRENRFVFLLRTFCYWLANVLFGMRLVYHSTEFELLDQSIIAVLRQVRTSEPFLRGLVLEYGRHIEKVYYTQDKRAAGTSHFNLVKYYEFAVGAMVYSGRCLPRRLLAFSLIGLTATVLEFFIGFLPGAAGMPRAQVGNGVILRFCLFVLLLLLLSLSLLFEFIVALRRDQAQKPIIVEEKRLNF